MLRENYSFRHSAISQNGLALKSFYLYNAIKCVCQIDTFLLFCIRKEHLKKTIIPTGVEVKTIHP